MAPVACVSCGTVLRDGVAIAIEDHYKPRFAGDALPRNATGLAVALAEMAIVSGIGATSPGR